MKNKLLPSIAIATSLVVGSGLGFSIASTIQNGHASTIDCLTVVECIHDGQTALNKAEALALSTTTTTNPVSTTTQPVSTTTQAVTTTTLGNTGCTRTISSTSNISSSANLGGVTCLNTGTYNQIVSLTATGIKVQAAPGATPVITGTGFSIGKTSDLVHLGGSDETFGPGITVVNSSGRAVTMTGADDKVIGNVVHNIQYNGILAAGTRQIIDGNEVYATTLSNTNDALGGSGWAEAVNTFQSSYTTITNNRVHDNWGEGICPINSNHITITGNTLVNNFSVGIYIAGSSTTLVDHNSISQNTTLYNRGSSYPTGVLLGNESGQSANIPTDDTITWNTLTHTSGIKSWNVVPVRLTVANNTIIP